MAYATRPFYGADASSAPEPAEGTNPLETSQGREFSEAELAEQRQELGELLRDEPELKEGSTWYLLPARWFQQWEAFVQIDGDRGRPGPHPGPINNNSLLDPHTPGALKLYLREQTDFVVKTEEVWSKLVALYGGGPPIPRQVVVSMWNYKSVEVYPLRLQILRTSKPSETHWVLFSKNAKLKEVREKVCKLLGVAPQDVRIWDYHNDTKLKTLEEPLNSLAEERILDGQKLLFEERLADGKFAKLTTNRDKNFDLRFSSQRVGPGQCGLQNLGNTCFMNSALQCLSNAVPLARFMVSGDFEAQINSDNPLGSGGELVSEFADLLQDMWSGRLTSVAPRDFKWKLERFAPQFSGWQQHDSQELMAFLLDGMHEDLNRIKKKPFFETNEFEHLSEGEAATKSWAQHVARNDSFIVDWCHGQLRSEVKCNVCPRVSKTFDPFMYMSVPLPEAKTRLLEVLYWPRVHTVPPTRYFVAAPKNGCVRDMMEVVSRMSGGYPADRLQLCDVYSQRFFKVFKPDEHMSNITDRDFLSVFECVEPPEDTRMGSSAEGSMDEVMAAPRDALTNVIVLLKEERIYSSSFYPTPQATHTGLDPPLIINAPRAVTYRELYAFLVQTLARFLTPVPADDPDADKPLFRIYKGGRQGQFRVELIDDGEVVELFEADNLIVAFDAQGCRKNSYNAAAAKVVVDHESAKLDPNASEGVLQLDQCISLFGEEEQLGEEDPWYCSQCKEHRRAFKRFSFWKMPKILIVHLKRFSYRSKHWREKIESLVNFPLEGLDMTRHVLGPITPGEEPIYDLFAISNHYGALGGGHYTAFAKNVNENKWFKFDDSSVSPVSDPHAVITPAAYVLFYQRRDTRTPQEFCMPIPARVAAADAAAAAGGAGATEAPAKSEDEEDDDSDGGMYPSAVRNVLSFSVTSAVSSDPLERSDSSTSGEAMKLSDEPD